MRSANHFPPTGNVSILKYLVFHIVMSAGRVLSAPLLLDPWNVPDPSATLPHDFEIVRPRLLAIYDKIDLNLPTISPHHHHRHRKQPKPYHHSSGRSGPLLLQEHSNASSYLLTFYTRDQTPFYAIIYPQEDQTVPTTTANPYWENQIDGEANRHGCDFYHGHLVTPEKGYLAVTTCAAADEDDDDDEPTDRNSSPRLTMSATIMLNTGQVLLIRSPQPTHHHNKNLYHPMNKQMTPEEPEPLPNVLTRESHRRRRRPVSKVRPPIKDNCYMAEYEKRQISIEDLEAETVDQIHPTKLKKKTESEPLHAQTEEDQLSSQHKLVYQFGRHYLYRLSDPNRGIPKIKETALNGRRQSPSVQNYSSCTERYIDQWSPTENSNEQMDSSRETITTESPRIVPMDSMDEEEPELLKSEHRLAKRDLTKEDVYSKTFTIETLIFVDASLMARFNGNRQELQKLILAIMNEVQLIYNFDSLKIRVRILIKQIVYLEGKDVPNDAEGDIDAYLDNFCAWQKGLWLKANRTARWDHALMLTGLDLYKKIGFKKNRKVLGLAWVNGMCRPAYSCTLNEGKNFEASFVIAHEMAHSLGMLHDGYDNNCDPERYIMSEKTGPGKINWSPCSNLYLENFLTKSNMRCLESTRADQIKRFSDPFDQNTDTRLPGEQYSLNQQCQLALGQQYKAYTTNKSPFHDVCKELWCSSGTWATPAHPALEGTACGRRKSCYQGTCVDKQQAFAKSKIKMYNNRRPAPPTSSGDRPYRAPPTAGHDDDDDDDRDSSASSSSQGGGPSFMRRVQRFLRSTIGSVVRFFG